LANAKVVQLYHSLRLNGKISIILNPEMTYSRSSSPADRKAAAMFDLYYNRLYMDPCMKGIFPEELIEDLKKHHVMFDATEEELALIRNNIIDFVGVNLYFPTRVKAPSHAWNAETPFHPDCYYEKFHLPGSQMNIDRGWEIYPKIIYDMGMRIKNEYNNMEWMITESGMGVMNETRFIGENGEIQDDYRINFINSHLYWAMKALEDGSDCRGYLLWAFTDCVSPMNAFKNRYGLIRIDLEHNRDRSMKKSGHYFKELSKKRELMEIATDAYK
ncbi:MAG: family 1 glycosylhydrolase, partial [Hungatella sp.]